MKTGIGTSHVPMPVFSKPYGLNGTCWQNDWLQLLFHIPFKNAFI